MLELELFLKKLKTKTRPSLLPEKHKPVLFILEFWDIALGVWISPLEVYDIHSEAHSILFRRNGVIEHHHAFSPYDSWVIAESSSRILRGSTKTLIRIKYRGSR